MTSPQNEHLRNEDTASNRQTEQPRISIVLPIYNRESTLSKAIDSVRSQLFEQWELLCIDDGSTDNSVELVKEYQTRDDRIKLFEINHKGVAAARNKGLDEARGQIISYLDSDNSWRSNYLYDVWNALRGKAGVSCYSAMRVNILDSDDRLIRQSTLLQQFDRRRILRRNQIDMNTFAHSRDLVAAQGAFDEQMTRLCDWELILRYTSERPPLRIDSIGADYFHHRSDNRVSMNAHYAPNRLMISLKSHSTSRLRAVFVNPGPQQELISSFEAAGFPVATVEKDNFDSFNLRPADIILWSGCEWDTNVQNMNQAMIKIEFDCALSFYLLSRQNAHSLVSLSSFNRLHFVVCDDEQHKGDFQSYIFELQKDNNQSDVNPLDRILLRHCPAKPDFCVTSFCQTMVDYSQADSAQPYEVWLDQSAAPKTIDKFQSVADLLADGSTSLRRNARSNIDHGVKSVLIYVTSHRIPQISRKTDEPRILLILGDDTGLDAVQLSQFDAVLFDNQVTADAYADEYPLLRTFYYESPTDVQWARLVRTTVGHLQQPVAMNLVGHQLPRITYIAGNYGAGSTRKRCYDMVNAIRSIFPIQVVHQREVALRHLVGSDLIIIQRWVERSGAPLEDFFYSVSRLKLAGKSFVYDLDDHVLDYAQGLPKTFLSICDSVSCSTPYLEQCLSKFHSNTYVAANMVNTQDLNIPTLNRVAMARSRRVICVSTDGLGYDAVCFMAEKTHARFSESIEFVFVSAIELTPNKHVSCKRHLTWEQLFELMCNCDVMLNLNEMSDQLDARLSGDGQLQYDRDAFIHSKSAIKYHDSALAGIALITTNAPQQFGDWIEHGKTGIIVDSHEQMLTQLLYLLENPEVARNIAYAARKNIFDQHTIATHWESLARRMVETYHSSEKLAHNWHQEDLSPTVDAVRQRKGPLARYARMLELGRLGSDRAAQQQDQKRLQQIAQGTGKLRKQEQLTSNEKRRVASLQKQVENKEHARAKVQADLDLTLQRLRHYQQPFIKRLVDAIKFRLKK